MNKIEYSRIYIFGASGSGSTTLGENVAAALGLVHVDADDHYWAPVMPPYSVKRPPQERVTSMKAALGEKGWVLSGSCNNWGGELVERANLIVFTTLSTPLRIQRLLSREQVRFGQRIDEGGDMFQIHRDFIDWAQRYDDPSFDGRNIGSHERWISEQTTKVCRINSECSVEDAVQTVLREMSTVS